MGERRERQSVSRVATMAGIADAGNHIGEMGVEIAIGEAEHEQPTPGQDLITSAVVV